MKTYITQDGERFEVRTARDLLRQMRGRAPQPGTTQLHWMRDVKRRVYQATHFRLTIDSETKFVAGLVKSGLLKEIPS